MLSIILFSRKIVHAYISYKPFTPTTKHAEKISPIAQPYSKNRNTRKVSNQSISSPTCVHNRSYVAPAHINFPSTHTVRLKFNRIT